MRRRLSRQAEKSVSVSLKWLREEGCESRCGVEDCEHVAKAFMSHLLGSTIFTDKSRSKAKVCYLAMLSDLPTTSSYSWRGMALPYL